MSKKDEALKLSMEALEEISSQYMSLPKKGCMALAAVEEALAEQPAQQQEPQPPYEFERYVAGSLRAQGVRVERATTLADAMRIAAKICPPANPPSAPTVLVYTSPPASKPWVGLTEEEKTEIRREHYARTLPLMDAVEAKLREKNA